MRYSRYEIMDGNDRDKHHSVFASAEHVLRKKFTEMHRDRSSRIHMQCVEIGCC